MEYEITNTEISRITLSEDNSTLAVDMTLWYNVAESKLQDSTTGCTITLDMTTGERATMKAELDTKVLEWFNKKFNPIV